MGFATAVTVQAGRIARARDEADARREQAEGLIDFMLGDLREKLEPLGRLDLLYGQLADGTSISTDPEIVNRGA